MSKQRNSKARLAVELIGPTAQVEKVIEAVMQAARSDSAVQPSYVEPVRITAHVRARTAPVAKPEM